MSQIFLKILNMGISAGYLVAAVVLLRLLLQRAPKWITLVLWGIVAIRLVCPLSVESVLSLLPSAETVSPDIMMDQTPEINTGIPLVNQAVNPIIGTAFAPDPATSANPLQLWIPTLAAVWIVGMVAFLVYAAVSYLRLRRRIGTAILLRDNLYQSEQVSSPFVFGIIRPRIYLPFRMRESDMRHVVAHESAHIRRGDHIYKPLGFLLLAVYWFHPLMWLGYILLCRDIELACDERVIRTLDRDTRADYSETLLRCSTERTPVGACPLAFGEVGIKARVKSVLSYKKPALWILIVAIVICAAVAVCFLTNPRSEPQEKNRYGETDPARLNETQRALMEEYPQYFGLDASNGLYIYVCQFAPTHYSVHLSQYPEEETGGVIPMQFQIGGVYIHQMREILATYDIDSDDVTVIPWQPMHSSYISPYFIYKIGEEEETQQRYIEGIKAMLFDAAP